MTHLYNNFLKFAYKLIALSCTGQEETATQCINFPFFLQLLFCTLPIPVIFAKHFESQLRTWHIIRRTLYIYMYYKPFRIPHQTFGDQVWVSDIELSAPEEWCTKQWIIFSHERWCQSYEITFSEFTTGIISLSRLPQISIPLKIESICGDDLLLLS